MSIRQFTRRQLRGRHPAGRCSGVLWIPDAKAARSTDLAMPLYCAVDFGSFHSQRTTPASDMPIPRSATVPPTQNANPIIC